MARVEIKNVERLISRLKGIDAISLVPLVQKSTLLVEAQAKALAPVNDGGLRMSIHPDVQVVGKKVVGKVSTAKEYAMYVEFGTGSKGAGTYPHEVKSLSLQYRSDGWVYTPDGGETFYYTNGMVARPFMYPSLEMNKGKIINIMNDGYKDLINRAIGG